MLDTATLDALMCSGLSLSAVFAQVVALEDALLVAQEAVDSSLPGDASDAYAATVAPRKCA